MGRGRLEVLVDNAWRTHDGRRGGEGCYDARRGVLHRDPRASPWPFRVTGMSYARARQRPKGLTVSQCARFGAASGGGRACGEKRRSVGQRAAPRTAGRPERGRDTCGSEGRSPPQQALPTALATRRACCLKAHHGCPSSPIPGSLAVVTRGRYMRPLHAVVIRDRYTRPLHAIVTRDRYTRSLHAVVTRGCHTPSFPCVVTHGRYTQSSHAAVMAKR